MTPKCIECGKRISEADARLGIASECSECGEWTCSDRCADAHADTHIK